MTSKPKKFREGGPIRQGIQSPAAGRARSDMAEDVMRRQRAAEPISKEERMRGRREMMQEPLSDEEIMRMGRGFKKGGMIKKKAGGMIKKMGSK